MSDVYIEESDRQDHPWVERRELLKDTHPERRSRETRLVPVLITLPKTRTPTHTWDQYSTGVSWRKEGSDPVKVLVTEDGGGSTDHWD